MFLNQASFFFLFSHLYCSYWQFFINHHASVIVSGICGGAVGAGAGFGVGAVMHTPALPHMYSGAQHAFSSQSSFSLPHGCVGFVRGCLLVEDAMLIPFSTIIGIGLLVKVYP